MVIFRISNYQL